MDEIVRSNIDYKRYNEYKHRNSIKLEFSQLEKITDKWGFIRQMYMEMMPDIIAKAKNEVCIPINPYFLDWSTHFSPIEYNAWISIRATRIALYPQFPLFNYFIDFANPYSRIGLELDGKNYHDEKKDKERDNMLYDFGWKIFRVKGSETHTEYKDITEIESDFAEYRDESQRYQDLSNWLLNSCDGVINAIRMVYFDRNFRGEDIQSLAMQSLEAHKLADFPLTEESE